MGGGSVCDRWHRMPPAEGESVSEDFKAVFSHDKGVLPLCRREFVFRDDGPSIFFIYEDFVGAHVNHGFDGEDHAWH